MFEFISNGWRKMLEFVHTGSDQKNHVTKFHPESGQGFTSDKNT